MQISNVTSLVNSAARYFFQSSWKGRTVQILCAVSFLSLIYYIAFRLYKTGKPSSQKPMNLKDRVQASMQPDLLRILVEAQLLEDLSDQIQTCNRMIDEAKKTPIALFSISLEKDIILLNETVKKTIVVLQASPYVQTEDWSSLLRECETFLNSKAIRSDIKKTILCLKNVKSWNDDLNSQIRKSPAFLKANLIYVQLGLPKKIEDCDHWITLAQGSSVQKNSCSYLLRKAIRELKEQVEPIFKSDAEKWRTFLENYASIINSRADLELCCNKFKTCLTQLQSWISA